MAGGAAANLYLAPGYDPAAVAAAVAEAPGVAAVAWGAALRATRTAVHADPARTPDLTVYGEPDVQFRERARVIVGRTATPLWNHGTLGEAMERVWLAARGPGIRPGPLAAWTDHTDILPAVHFLLGMPDAGLDGRVPVELLEDALVPAGARSPEARRLAAALKQAEAPLGALSQTALAFVMGAARSGDAAVMAAADADLAELLDRRDALAAHAQDRLRALLASEPPDPAMLVSLAAALEGVAAALP